MASGDKQAAVTAYMDKHQIRKQMEDVINMMVRDQGDDPFGFAAQKFAEISSSKDAAVDRLVGREVLDSRGNPTVEVDVYCKVGGVVKMVARGSAPSGASTGSNEALELRDKENKDRYMGKGVTKAVANVAAVLSPAVRGMHPKAQRDTDAALCKADGTELKTTVGGNAITAASFALAEAGAVLSNQQLFQHFAAAFHSGELPKSFRLPTPMVNIINGGKHGGGDLMFQEFMILPNRDLTFKEKLRYVVQVYHHLAKVLSAKYGPSSTNLGDEGGFAPPINNAEEALDAIAAAVSSAGFELGKDIKLAMDVAASEFYDKDAKTYEAVKGQKMTTDELLDYYGKLVDKFPSIVSIEDALDEKDYDGWTKFTKRFGGQMMVVGDDLYTTNTRLIKQGIEAKWANALLLKVNQIGSVSEAMDAARMIFEAGGNVVVSHRSGETPNSTIADLAVGIGASHIKTGAPARGERVAKYNRLLQIEEYLMEHNLLSP